MLNNRLQVVAEGFSFLESPRWHGGALYVSDFYLKRVMRIATNGSVDVVAQLTDQPSGVGFTPSGQMIVVSMTERRLLTLHDGRPNVLADLGSLTNGHCNDLLVDARGRCYVGNFGWDTDVSDQ